MFRSPLKPSSGGPWPYFAMLLNWNVDYICYRECRYVAVCYFIPCVCVCVCVWCVCVCVCLSVCVCGYQSGREYLDQMGTHTHTKTERSDTDTLYNKRKSTFQFSNLAKYGHGPLKMVSKEIETCRGEF
jgi:hypothetical protein